jgi:hypothetical protein
LELAPTRLVRFRGGVCALAVATSGSNGAAVRFKEREWILVDAFENRKWARSGGYFIGSEGLPGPPFRTIVDYGIQGGIHGDGVPIAPLNAWLHIYCATTGVNSFGDQVNPGHNLTRATALRLFTRYNKLFLRAEEKPLDRTRQIADLAALERDYFTVPDATSKRSVLC